MTVVRQHRGCGTHCERAWNERDHSSPHTTHTTQYDTPCHRHRHGHIHVCTPGQIQREQGTMGSSNDFCQLFGSLRLEASIGQI